MSIELLAFDYELVALLLAHGHDRNLAVDTGVCQKVKVDSYTQMNSMPTARTTAFDVPMPQDPRSLDAVGANPRFGWGSLWQIGRALPEYDVVWGGNFNVAEPAGSVIKPKPHGTSLAEIVLEAEEYVVVEFNANMLITQ